MTSSEIRSKARESLANKWGKGALIAFCYFIIEFLISTIISSSEKSLPIISLLFNIGNIVISVPLSYGIIISYMKLKRSEEVKAFDFITDGFSNFEKSWGVTWNIVKKMILPIILIVVIYILLSISITFAMTFSLFKASSSTFPFFLTILCTLALIGIYIWAAIKYLLYALSYQIAYDNPNFSNKEVVDESEKLMNGNRGKYFALQLSFIGWGILACLTFGIGTFWLTPYITVATICFYENLAGKYNSPATVDSEKVE